MTTITIDSALLEQALDALTCSGDNDDPGHRCSHCDDYVDRNSVVRQALRAALAAQPSNYSDWQQRRGVLADIVDEALASYEAWMAEDDYNATDALHKIMDHMRQRAASYAKPAQQPAPAWHDAPTVPGVWVCDEGDICYTWTAHNIEILDIEPEDEVRWYGPIPPDGDTK